MSHRIPQKYEDKKISIITIPFTFSAGAVIIAAQHNSNFQTIAQDYNGFIDNTNIATNAGIVYGKLNLASSIKNSDINPSNPIVGSNLDLSSPGTIGNTAPNTGAFTTLKVGTTHQGDVLYDNGTSLVRLTPGTSGQFLQTQGTSANPVWATNGSLSNCLFQYSAATTLTGSGLGEIAGTTLTPTTATGNYRFLSNRSSGGSVYNPVWGTKWKKVAGVSTVTYYSQIWLSGAGPSTNANIKVDIGGQNSNVSGTLNQVTPEWVTNTIDVSGLSNGTVYDVTVSLTYAASSTLNIYLGNLIAFGS